MQITFWRNTETNSSRQNLRKIEPIKGSIRSKDKLLSIGRYAAVGLMGTLLDIGLYALLHIVLGMPILLANSVSYCAGMINNYFFHRYWTFSNRSHKAVSLQLSEFAVVSLSGLIVNNLLVLLLGGPFALIFASDATSDLLSKVTAQGLSMCWNFLVNHLWTFREPVKVTHK
ncbi:MAG: GtrA family protein [Anaerolineaceae bacterium]|nr:GtrA family protein [Anaerolineaceae bacterium]